jgi:hypothetical protein
MSLVNPSFGTPVPAVTTDAKELKKAANQRASGKARENKQKLHEMMLAVRDVTKANGTFEAFTQDLKDYILAACVPLNERQGHTGPSFFNQVFGPGPKVGTSVTLEQILNTTFKGVDTMSAYIKKWSNKGIIVEVKQDKFKMLNTTYTITALPSGSNAE